MRTVGVEEELLLVDEATAKPVAVAEAVILRDAAQFHAAGSAELEHELKPEQIEVVNPPHLTLSGTAAAIREGRRRADEAARAAGARVVAMATSFSPIDPHIIAGNERFERMVERYALTLKEQLTCGFHVHVSVESPEEGVGALDRIRPWLPTLLALSGNSPFWQGADTGFSSYRYQAWSRWPSAGVYECFGSADRYREVVDGMLGTGVPLDEGMIYFDARLSRNYPTVEVRVADVCLDARHAAAVAAITRALVDTAAAAWAAGEEAPPCSVAQLRLASWQASRAGVTDELVHPVTLRPVAPMAAIEALIEHVAPALERSGDLEEVERIVGDILADGSGSTVQRAAFERNASEESVVRAALEATHA